MLKSLQPKVSPQGDDTKRAIIYFTLSFLSGALETGVVTVGVINFNLFAGLAFVFAYQVGCLTRNPLRLSSAGAALALCCSLPLLFLIHDSIPMLLIVTLLVSTGIQCAREGLLTEQYKSSLATKRIVRVSGFICGILGGAIIGVTLLTCISILACLIVVFVAIRTQCRGNYINLNKKFLSDRFGWIMLFHQVHYFAYAYVLLAILLTPQPHSLREPAQWQIMTSSGWFALGWFSYISGKWLFMDVFKMSPFQAVVTGHIWVVGCLACMAAFNNHQFILGLAWVLGGFGGGSVYAIKDLARKCSCKADMELWEHWGHVIGVFLSIVSVFVFPCNLAVPFILALIAALLTLMLLLSVERPTISSCRTRRISTSIRIAAAANYYKE